MCWGRNDYGQLGINSVANRDSPGRVGLVSGEGACTAQTSPQSMAVFRVLAHDVECHQFLNRSSMSYIGTDPYEAPPDNH
jgi:hypothetical protein